MARPIEYDKETVLNNAMSVFWQKGYDATSMSDLIQSTGLTSRSMYNLFGSKNGLFKACLEWYFEVKIRNRYERLICENGTIAIKNFLVAVAEGKTQNGCLYVNTVSDRNNIDETCLEIADDFFYDLESAFKSKLLYAQEFEGYKDDPAIRAKQLVVIIKGMGIHSKNPKSKEENKQIVDDLLSLMNI